MKLKEIYEIAIDEGIRQDPRGQDLVNKQLKENKELLESLPKDKRNGFDYESLNNPYADTRILCGDKEKEAKCALVGIDIDVGEIVLADLYNSKNKEKIDLCISHHPEGVAWAGFYEVMGMQAQILSNFGIPINIGEELLEERIREVSRKVHAANHNRSVDAAKLLGLSMMCTHTASDNFAYSYIKNLLDKEKPENLEDIIAILEKIPEYKLAIQDKAGPRIIRGDAKRKTGKIIVEMTGGTTGSKDIYDSYAKAGIGTMVCMHLSEEHFNKAKEKHLNIILAGHIASDSLGMNLLLDKVQKKGKFDIIACSGFRRVSRK